jgi:D-3-phosphoglycerate dehydrogenase
VVATPHIAASTTEGQELVGVETAAALRDFLKDGVIRNAVNFPAVSQDEFKRLQPFLALGERLGSFLAQMSDRTAQELSLRYYGDLAKGRTDMVTNAVIVGLFRSILSSAVTLVNARTVAAERGLEVAEATSTRARDYTALISVKLQTPDGKRWVEGAVFEPSSARLVMLDGVAVEASLEGTMIVTANTDQPGVIGAIGTVLGRHGVNIASFALGREGDHAVGLITVDEAAEIPERVLEELRGLPAVRAARLVRL